MTQVSLAQYHANKADPEWIANRRRQQRDRKRERRAADLDYRAACRTADQRYAAKNADARAAKERERRVRQWARVRIPSFKKRARDLGLGFDLTESDLIIPETCPILGIPIEFGIKPDGKKNGNNPSVDRVDNTQGYVRGNIRIISYRANRLKSDASLSELRRIVAYMENHNANAG